ncbi:hypothetical protein L7F22_014020 [Adiantum nelumboides]|nr:hypothetical protein [Adiantum nelumboides]
MWKIQGTSSATAVLQGQLQEHQILKANMEGAIDAIHPDYLVIEGKVTALSSALIALGVDASNSNIRDEVDRLKLGNKEATAEWVASKYMEKFRDHPIYRPKELVTDLCQECGVSISYKVAWKAKQVALGAIHGDHAKAYGKLHSYCSRLVASSLGTVAHLQSTNEGRFFCLFLAFGACITGFSHCHALIGLDGTFLTSKYLGALMIATRIDAMGALFPIAFGLADAKNEVIWVWFLQNLHENLADVNGLCFISDKQKGLLPAVEVVFLGCEHAYYMRHLDANLKKKCNNGEFIRLFWVAAYASTIAGYEEAIEGMKAINDLATTNLLNTSPPSHWATTYFKGRRYGHLTSNIIESLHIFVYICN